MSLPLPWLSMTFYYMTPNTNIKIPNTYLNLTLTQIKAWLFHDHIIFSIFGGEPGVVLGDNLREPLLPDSQQVAIDKLSALIE